MTTAQNKLTTYLITSACLLFGFAVLIFGMNLVYMRADEFLTIGNLRYSFEESMLRLATRNNQAHLWWITMWVWQRLVGITEFTLRYHSILLSMLTLSVIYRMGKDWFGESQFGWFAIILVSANSYFFIYSLEARMYALAMLTTVLSMRAFYGWLTKRTWKSAIFYGLSISAMMYTHYYMAFVVIAQVVYFLIFHLLNLKLFKQGLVAGGIALLTWLPGILIIYNQLQFIRFATKGGLNIPTETTNPDTIIALAQLSTSGWVWIYLPIIITGLALLWRKIAYRLILTWLLVATGLVLVINLRSPIFTERYTSYSAPTFGILAGFTLASIPIIFAEKFKHQRKMIHLGIWIAVLLLAGLSLYRLPTQLPERTPLRDIYREMSAVSPDGTGMYLSYSDADGNHRQTMDWYLTPEIKQNWADSVDEASSMRHVWFVSNNWHNDSVREQFAQLSQTHRLMQVIGECKPAWCYLAQLMVAPPNREPILFADTIGFHGADITITSKNINALLWWTVSDQPTQDYSISLQLLDSSGNLISQVDRQIQPPDGDEIPTSQMLVGNSYIDYREIRIPQNLPSGEYRLQLVVYQWQDNTRLTLSDGRDTLPVDSIILD